MHTVPELDERHGAPRFNKQTQRVKGAAQTMHNGFSVSSRVDGGVPPGIDADQLSSVSGRSSEKMLFLEEGHIIYLPTAVNDTELLHTDGGNVQFESEDVENDRSGGLPPQIDDEQLED